MAQSEQMVPGDATSRRIWQWLVARYHDQQLSLETKLQTDLGIDSIEWIDVTLAIGQQCGVEIRDDALMGTQTIGDLLRLASESPRFDPNRSGRSSAVEAPEEVLGNEGRFWLLPLGLVELAAARCIYAFNWVLMRLLLRVRISGSEYLLIDGNFVLAPHHTSYLDSLVLGAALRFGLLRQSYWAAWTGVAFSPIFRVLRRLTHVVPVDMARGAVSSLAYGAAVLRRKHNLIWFPEGRISPSGEVLSLKPGIGLLLARYPAPVVLVHIEGTREALPPGHRVPRPGRVQITFSRPLYSGELERVGDGAEPHERITDALHQELVRFCGARASGSSGVDKWR